MDSIGIRQLKEKTSQVMRRVRENNETIAITYRGREIARIVPTEDPQANLEHDLKVWAEMDELAKEIGAIWPEGVSVEQAVREQRREL
jgi:prevent-host-death family protein